MDEKKQNNNQLKNDIQNEYSSQEQKIRLLEENNLQFEIQIQQEISKNAILQEQIKKIQFQDEKIKQVLGIIEDKNLELEIKIQQEQQKNTMQNLKMQEIKQQIEQLQQLQVVMETTIQGLEIKLKQEKSKNNILNEKFQQLKSLEEQIKKIFIAQHQTLNQEIIFLKDQILKQKKMFDEKFLNNENIVKQKDLIIEQKSQQLAVTNQELLLAKEELQLLKNEVQLQQDFLKLKDSDLQQKESQVDDTKKLLLDTQILINQLMQIQFKEENVKQDYEDQFNLNAQLEYIKQEYEKIQKIQIGDEICFDDISKSLEQESEQAPSLVKQQIDYSLTLKQEFYKVHQGLIQSMIMLRSGDLVSGGQDKMLNFWHQNTLIKFLPMKNTICSLLEIDQKIIIGLSNGFIEIIDTISFQEIKSFKAHESFVNSIIFQNPQILVTASSDKTIKLWDFQSYNLMRTYTQHVGSVNVLINLQDGYFASGSLDKSIKIWEPQGRCYRTLIGHTSSINCLLLLQNNCIASGSNDSTIRIWRNYELETTITGNSSAVTYMIQQPKNLLIYSANQEGIIKLWDIDGNCVHTQKQVHDYYISTIINKDNELITSSYDSSIKIWQINNLCID